MRGSIALRVFIATVIIGLTCLGMYGIQSGKQITAEMPAWNLNDLPMQLGEWKGKDTELDERLNRATGAQAIVNRVYTNESGTSLSMHFAAFTDPDVGIWHTPVNCYISAGWRQTSIEKTPLSENADEKAQISLSTWTKSGENALVLYWFQLGEHRLYDRFDLGTSIRWQMRGRKTWPALIKVLVTAPAGNKPEETKEQMLGFADLIYQWINQPQHEEKSESIPATK